MKKGIVIKSTGSWYSVREVEGTLTQCRLSGSFRTKGVKTTNPIVVGDWVFFKPESNKDTGVISSLEPRRNYMIRQATNLSKRWHIIASNIDIGFLVVSLRDPKVLSSFIDRYLLSSEAYGVPTVLVFNKSDLYTAEDKGLLNDYISAYTKAGYKCIIASVIANKGIDEIKALGRGKISLFSGYSGVGKSSIVSELAPNATVRIGETSVHEKGKHTTTFSEMYVTDPETFIIDTPGIKSFGIVEIAKEEVAHYYPEFFKLSSQCRFNNCIHINEPGCAVIKSVEEGGIKQFRYENYLSIYHGDGYRNHWEDK